MPTNLTPEQLCEKLLAEINECRLSERAALEEIAIEAGHPVSAPETPCDICATYQQAVNALASAQQRIQELEQEMSELSVCPHEASVACPKIGLTRPQEPTP